MTEPRRGSRAARAASAAAAIAAALVGYAATSDPIASAIIGEASTAIGISDGDLWPSCWSRDDALYSANGDGAGFGDVVSDIVMNRIIGAPATGDLEGVALAVGDDIGEVWSGDGFTRKPTGMLCANDTIYLAVQDLALDFNEAPAATIARSDDHGTKWSWDPEARMFDDGVFTTLWFADFGQDARHAPEHGYVYAFGLDGNWRDSFTDVAPDPTELFLAQVPVDTVQDAATWKFYAGEPGDAWPTWSRDIKAKKPVLTDDRRVHELSVLSQGGVTYLPQRNRYVYTSWTEYGFEFYEAPQP